MPRDAGKPSVANLRSSAQAVRSAISGQSGAIADALTAIAAALDQVQAAVESLEGKNRELASPDTNDPRRRSTAYVSGDRIIGGISVQGVLPSVAGQSLDLTLQNQVGTIAATDHNTGGPLGLLLNPNGGRIGAGTSAPQSELEVAGGLNLTGGTKPSAGNSLNLGFDAVNNVGYVQAVTYAVSNRPLVLGGGKVLLAAISPGGDISTGTANVRITIDGGTGLIKIALGSVAVYANNAAAVAAGLTAGMLYRTGADPDPVCIVH